MLKLCSCYVARVFLSHLFIIPLFFDFKQVLTQKQLSEMTGIAVPNISKMEKGSRNIGANTARKLAAVLECDISDFI